MKNNDPGPNKPGKPAATASTQAQLQIIKNWVAQLNVKKNLKQSKTEVMNVVQSLGSEGSIYLVQQLLESLDLSGLSLVAKGSLSTTVKGQCLSTFLHELIFRSAPANAFEFVPHAFIKAFPSTSENAILGTVADVFRFLKIPLIDQLFITLAFANYSGGVDSSETPDTHVLAAEGLKLFKDKLAEYSVQANPPSLPSNNSVALLVSTILRHSELQEIVISCTELQAVISQVLSENGQQGGAIMTGESAEEDGGVSQKTFSPADVLHTVGIGATESAESLDSALKQFTQWTNSDLYTCIELMAIQAPADASKGDVDWNIDEFADYIQLRHIQPKTSDVLSWSACVAEIDRHDLQLRDEKAFRRFWIFVAQISKRFNIQIATASLLLKRWKHTRSQIQFLRLLLSPSSLPDLVRWNEVQSKSIMNLDFNSAYKYSTLQPPSAQFFACLDIYELLVELSEVPSSAAHSTMQNPQISGQMGEEPQSNFSQVYGILEAGIVRHPDLIVVGLAQLKNKKVRIVDEIYSVQFPWYLVNHANSIQILEAIWKHNEDLFISAICEVYRKDYKKKENTSLQLSRVLDISQYIKDSLIALTNCSDYSFAVSLGVLAGKREFLHFEQWLNQRIRQIGDPFVSAVLNYVDENILLPLKEISTRGGGVNPQMYEGVLEKAQLTMEILSIIFESLLVEQSAEKITAKNRSKLGELYKELIVYFPQLSGPSDASNQGTEKKSNYNFQRFYGKEITAEELVNTMRVLSSSVSSEDREVNACMLANLVQETKFHESYPQQELLLTAHLFGTIISQGMANGPFMTVMLEKIIEASRVSQKRVEFAVRAVESMRDQVHLFPDFVRALLDTTKLISMTHPHYLLSIYNVCVERKAMLNIDPRAIEELRQRTILLDAQRAEQAKLMQSRNNMMPLHGIQPSVDMQHQDPLMKPPYVNATTAAATTPATTQIATDDKGPAEGGNPTTKKIQLKKPLKVLKAASTTAVFDPTNNSTSTNTAATNTSDDRQQLNSQKAFISNNVTPFNPNSPSIEDPKGLALSHSMSAVQQQQQHLQMNAAAAAMQSPFNPASGVVPPNQLGNINAFNPNHFHSVKQQFDHHGGIASGFHQQLQQPGQQPQQYYEQGPNEFQDAQIGRPYSGGVWFVQNDIDLNVDVALYSKSSIQQILQFEDRLTIEDSIRNKVVFALNNLSDMNMEKHSNDFRIYTDNEIFSNWFVKHLVLRRAPHESEGNFGMYLGLLHKIGKPSLFNALIIESELLLHKVLLSELPPQATERNILKNIGYWIGLLTIHRNKAINAKYLNIKALVINSYPSKLDIVVPIVCNILRPAKDSKIFSPQSNRWIRRILSLLDELKAIAPKETIKLYINQLFVNFQVDPQTLEVCTYFSFLFQESKRLAAKMQSQSYTLQQQQLQQQQPQQSQQQLGGGVDAQQWQYNSRPISMAGKIIVGEDIREVLKIQDIVDLTQSALEKGLEDIIKAVVNKSLQIALITTRELCLKDHCQDPSADSLLKNAKAMIQRYSGQLALISSKEPLRIAFTAHLKSILDKLASIAIAETDRDKIVSRIVADNIDAGCQEVRERVIKQSIEEISKDLMIQQAVQVRQQAPTQEPFVDEQYYQYVRLLPLALQQRQQPHEQAQKKMQEYITYTLVFTEMQNRLDLSFVYNFVKSLVMSDELHNGLIDLTLTSCMFTDVQKTANFSVSVLEILEDTLDHDFSERLKAAFLKQTNQRPFDFKTLPAVLTSIFERKLLSENQISELLITWTMGSNENAFVCASKVLQEILFEKKLSNPSDFSSLIFAMRLKASTLKDHETGQLPQDYSKLITSLNNKTASNIENVSEFKKITHSSALSTISKIYGMHFDKDAYLYAKEKIDEWLAMKTYPEISDYITEIANTYLGTQSTNYLKFFVYYIDICISHAIKSDKQLQEINNKPWSNLELSNIDMTLVDNFTKLIGIYRKSLIMEDKAQKIQKIFECIFIVLIKYHEEDGVSFRQRPFYRLFFNLIYDMQRPQYDFLPSDKTDTYSILTVLFHKLRPLKYPGFAYAWLELVSNRHFLPYLMENEVHWHAVLKLIIDLLQFLFEILREDANMRQESVMIFYRGTIRVLLVLLHDWPDFLARFSNQFCDEIPGQYVQIRNIVLAAFPKSMKPPDPFSNNEQILESNEDLRAPPVMDYPIFTEKMAQLNLAADFQSYFQTKKDETFKLILSKIMVKSTNPKAATAFTIDTKALNTLIIAIPLLISYLPPNGTKAYTQREDSLAFLIVSSYTEREAIFTSMINQVRYPNLISKFYIIFLLQIFREPSIPDIHEQAIRIISERLHAQKPHPWGIIFTFFETSKLKPSSYKITDFRPVLQFISPEQKHHHQNIPNQQQQLSGAVTRQQQQLLQQQQQQQQPQH